MSNIFPGGSMQPSCCLLLCGKVPVFSVGIWGPATDENHCARVRKHPSTTVRRRFQAFAQLPSLYKCCRFEAVIAASRVEGATCNSHGGAGLRGEALLLRRMGKVHKCQQSQGGHRLRIQGLELVWGLGLS